MPTEQLGCPHAWAIGVDGDCACTLCETKATLWLNREGVPDVIYAAQPHQIPYHESSVPNLIMIGPRGTGKAVALDTLLPTMNGYRRMASVEVGDRLIGSDGAPTKVLWKSEAHIDPLGTYRVTFDEGSEIVCGGGHEWHTINKLEAASPLDRSGVRTTVEISQTLKACKGRETNHRIPMAGAWQFPEQALPIDPYVLGAWLGDGTAGAGQITSQDGGVLSEIVAAGYEINGSSEPDRFGIAGLAEQLRRLDAREEIRPRRTLCRACQKDRCLAARGLCFRCYNSPKTRAKFGKWHKGFKRFTGGVFKNKYIPSIYLIASAQQRLALLQGLMDTDGYCCPKQGTVEFCNTNFNLAQGVYDLAVSLGAKPTLREGRAMLYGKDCGPKYRVCWTSSVPVFRLKRKLKHLRVPNSRARHRFIVKVERIPDVPLQCVTVSAPDHLYLVGRAGIPTHNSLTLRMDLHMRALQVPGLKYLVLRRTMPELKRSHLIYINEEMQKLGGDFHNTDSVARYPNGSIGFYGHLDTAADAMKFLSAEYDIVAPDEIVTFTNEQILRIASCIRVPLNSGRIGLLRGGMNKLGIGAEFVKKYFVDKNVPPEEDADYNPADYGVIVHTFEDNAYIDRKQYRARLAALPEHVRKAWLDDEWVVEGAYFPDFRPSIQGEPWHVIHQMPQVNGRPFLSQQWVNIYRAIDWGYDPDPAVCLWIAVLPNKRAVVFKERTWRRTKAADVAIQIRALSEGMRITETVCDPTMVINDGKGTYSIGEIFENNGIPLTPSTNKRDLYGYAIHDYLNTVIDERPKLQILSDQGAYGCPQLIKTLPMMRTDPKDPNKIADGEDHHVCALSYHCMGGSMPAQAPTSTTRAPWMLSRQALWRQMMQQA